MGAPRGFLDHERELPARRPVASRLGDYHDVYDVFPLEKVTTQAARCMDCGIPFCQSGCPLGNIIPDWNDLVYRGRWREAYERLQLTNNFPEFTGRICPAPCESACVLGLIDEPVTIERIEQEIIEQAFRSGWVQPQPPAVRTGKTVAVVGSGPAGLAAADQLNRAGHTVTVYERDDRPGGLLRYGIPDFKLEKRIVQRRIELMEAEGIRFACGVHLGVDRPASVLDAFDAVVLCTGATEPRDLPIPGRALDGVHFAWDFLAQQNRRVAGDAVTERPIRAEGKHVVVIGGGDTGSDCVGTANRHGAASVTQFELLPMPPETRLPHQPWPFHPGLLQTSSSHEEGGARHWKLLTKAFLGEAGRVTALRTVEVEARRDAAGRLSFDEREGTAATWPADLVLLAIGYAGPERAGLLADLGVAVDARGTIRTENYATNRPGVFAAGDARRGQSLVVWAISEGREAARAVDVFLVGETNLRAKGVGDLPRV